MWGRRSILFPQWYEAHRLRRSPNVATLLLAGYHGTKLLYPNHEVLETSGRWVWEDCQFLRIYPMAHLF